MVIGSGAGQSATTPGSVSVEIGGTAVITTTHDGASAYTHTLADADVGMSKDAAAITHSGSTSLTVASTNGPVLVESVTFTGDAITGAGALTMSGDLALATDKFTVASSSGNTACAGTFEVGGNKFTVDAAGAGVFASTVTASGSQLTSDARWKTNVANLTGPTSPGR